MTTRYPFVLAIVLAALVGTSPGAALAQDDEDQEVFEFEDYQQVLDLFASYGYTPEAWQAGERKMPRVVLANVPER